MAIIVEPTLNIQSYKKTPEKTKKRNNDFADRILLAYKCLIIRNAIEFAIVNRTVCGLNLREA